MRSNIYLHITTFTGLFTKKKKKKKQKTKKHILDHSKKIQLRDDMSVKCILLYNT